MEWVRKDRTIVCLQGSDSEIQYAKDMLEDLVSFRYSEFRDEDLGNMLTAVAFWPMTKNEADEWIGFFRLA